MNGRKKSVHWRPVDEKCESCEFEKSNHLNRSRSLILRLDVDSLNLLGRAEKDLIMFFLKHMIKSGLVSCITTQPHSLHPTVGLIDLPTAEKLVQDMHKVRLQRQSMKKGDWARTKESTGCEGIKQRSVLLIWKLLDKAKFPNLPERRKKKRLGSARSTVILQAETGSELEKRKSVGACRREGEDGAPEKERKGPQLSILYRNLSQNRRKRLGGPLGVMPGGGQVDSCVAS
ncbi:hypothetical protein KSP40_PGU004075 [Platanthera guangdongensis]|uniref:Uncharacterized protein n=1 Tax=Platanthera guangdongensis TaxID=2320717 RepID=A0ABR2LXY6_9ASPA